MKYSLITISVLALALNACESGTGNNKTIETPVITTPVTTPTTTPTTTPATTPTTTTTTTTTQPNISTTPSPVPIVNTPGKGLNPAHGQPGHRCDIAVGAPLDTKPSATPTTINTSTPVVTPTVTPAPIQTSTPVTATAPGMNPAHGQPGHRCDISVGAPLNSKPAASVITTPVTPVKQ